MALNTKELTKLASRLNADGMTEEADELCTMIKRLAEPTEMGEEPDILERGPTEIGEPSELLHDMDELKADLTTNKDDSGIKDKIQKLMIKLEAFLSDLPPSLPTGQIPVGAVASKTIELADSLDAFGLNDESEKLDKLIQKLAITMVEDTDEEFKKLLERERIEQELGPVDVYVGKPEQDVSPKDIMMPGQEQEVVLLDDELREKLSKLTEQGWDVFGPGDLERWMDAKGYKKMQDMPEEEVMRIQKELDMKASKKIAGTFDTDDETPQSEDPNLQPHAPGAFDIDSPHRIKPVKVDVDADAEELRREFDALLENPSEAAGDNIKSKILEFIKSKEIDAGAASEIERIEKEKGVHWAVQAQVFEKLATIADKLDGFGAVDEADLIGGFIKKHADDVLDYQQEDEKSDQSKRYDDKYHHSLQIREPKTKQERIDREGRGEHHINTMQHVGAGGLSTRYCVDHVGVMLGRIGENTYQCPLDGAVFNWETGWTDLDGKEHPGGSVAQQTPDSSGYQTSHRVFDSRENTLNSVT